MHKGQPLRQAEIPWPKVASKRIHCVPPVSHNRCTPNVHLFSSTKRFHVHIITEFSSEPRNFDHLYPNLSSSFSNHLRYRRVLPCQSHESRQPDHRPTTLPHPNTFFLCWIPGWHLQYEVYLFSEDSSRDFSRLYHVQ
jgi:hypothetical protein